MDWPYDRLASLPFLSVVPSPFCNMDYLVGLGEGSSMEGNNLCWNSLVSAWQGLVPTVFELVTLGLPVEANEGLKPQAVPFGI